MGELSKAFLAVVGGAFTLALVSVILSRRAATSDVVSSVGSALSNVIGAATSPVTGAGGSGGGGLASGGLQMPSVDVPSLAGFAMPSFFSQWS